MVKSMLSIMLPKKYSNISTDQSLIAWQFWKDDDDNENNFFYSSSTNVELAFSPAASKGARQVMEKVETAFRWKISIFLYFSALDDSRFGQVTSGRFTWVLWLLMVETSMVEIIKRLISFSKNRMLAPVCSQSGGQFPGFPSSGKVNFCEYIFWSFILCQ